MMWMLSLKLWTQGPKRWVRGNNLKGSNAIHRDMDFRLWGNAGWYVQSGSSNQREGKLKHETGGIRDGEVQLGTREVVKEVFDA